MLKIFATKNTDEKAVILCRNEEVIKHQEYLNSIYGGSWVMVDDFNAPDEILMFKDGMVYSGFNENLRRYTSALHPVKEITIENKKSGFSIIQLLVDAIKGLPADHVKVIETKKIVIESVLSGIAPKYYQDAINKQIKENGLPKFVVLGDNCPQGLREVITLVLPEKSLPGIKVPGIGFAWEGDKLDLM